MDKIIPCKNQCEKYRRCRISTPHSETLNESIMKITKTNQTFYLCGDFSVNISPESSNPSANDFLNMILGNSAFPTITIPTCVMENSKTIIDNIITKDSNIILPGIIRTDVSDHFVIFYFTMNFNKPPKTNIKIHRRDKSKFNSEEFCRQLASNLQAFNPQICSATPDNFNQLIAEFVTLIENTIKIHASLKSCHVNSKNYSRSLGLQKTF